MELSLIITVFLLTSTVFMLFIGYMSTRSVLPSREEVHVDEFQHRMSQLMLQGELRTVVEQASQELQAKPQFAAAYVYRAEALRQLEHHDDAIADYTSALEFMDQANNAAQAEILHARGLLWQKTGEHHMAVRDFDDRLALLPGCGATHQARAMSLFKMQDYQHSLNDANLAIKINPHDPAGYELRGEIRKALSQSDGAELDFLRAKRLREGTADW